MYDYLKDKEFLHKMRVLSGGIMQALCHFLKEDYDIGASFCLIGSGAKNLILQNNNNPVDLDYDLEIVKCENFKDGRYLRECVRKAFNKALFKYRLPNCRDSKSTLRSQLIYFDFSRRMGLRHCYSGSYFDPGFSIDICVIMRDGKDNYYRLIHKETGLICTDEYYWNIAPKLKEVKKKADYIKKCGKWELVRQQYKNIKNHYLEQNDFNRPSYICYAEAVNNVNNSRKHW